MGILIRLCQGQQARSVAAHAINDRSSRSHAILTLWIEITLDSKHAFVVRNHDRVLVFRWPNPEIEAEYGRFSRF